MSWLERVCWTDELAHRHTGTESVLRAPRPSVRTEPVCRFGRTRTNAPHTVFVPKKDNESHVPVPLLYEVTAVERKRSRSITVLRSCNLQFIQNTKKKCSQWRLHDVRTCKDELVYVCSVHACGIVQQSQATARTRAIICAFASKPQRRLVDGCSVSCGRRVSKDICRKSPQTCHRPSWAGKLRHRYSSIRRICPKPASIG